MTLMLVKKLRRDRSVMISGTIGCSGSRGRVGTCFSIPNGIGGGQASSGLEDSVEEEASGWGESEWRLQIRK